MVRLETALSQCERTTYEVVARKGRHAILMRRAGRPVLLIASGWPCLEAAQLACLRLRCSQALRDIRHLQGAFEISAAPLATTLPHCYGEQQ